MPIVGVFSFVKSVCVLQRILTRKYVEVEDKDHSAYAHLQITVTFCNLDT